MSGGGNRAACQICEGTPKDPPKGRVRRCSFSSFREVNVIDRNEACELLLVSRNYLYQLLYKAFAREPDKAFLELLTSETTRGCFELLGVGIPEELSAGLTRLRGKADDAAFTERLREEYTRLFVGPLEMDAPPWESVYVGEEGMLFQESTLQVRACYHRFGLLPEEYPRVADDSLALELGFMAELARRAADAFGAGDAETLDAALRGARDFLKEHLLVWVPLLAERAGKTGTAPLYPQLLRILDSFLKQDRETLNDILSEGVHAHD